MECNDVTYCESEHNSLLYTLSNFEDDVGYTIDNDDSDEESDAGTGPITTLVQYLVSKILGKIQGTEMLVDLENLGTR